MNNLKLIFILIILFTVVQIKAQTTSISGNVSVEGNLTPYVLITISEINEGAYTDESGHYTFENIPYGEYTLTASHLGHKDVSKIIQLKANEPNLMINFDMKEASLFIDDVVITGTKTFKRKTNSPVIVNVVTNRTLNQVQACNLSEGLKFQPGLRVETDCQTCNYTQLRMNGLAGGYSQILVNGRPIFSPLTGLYGMEQLPTNMIERIEVVRGGGSSLYGSSAIGGTVNVITRLPKKNGANIDYSYQNIDGQTHDHIINGNATVVSDHKKAGVSIFTNYRNRGFYDENDDNFSEIPKIENKAIGANVYYKPDERQKIELSASYVNEYRFGGEMISDKPAHQALQSEERNHDVLMASADYQINFSDDNSLITYFAGQYTDRKHYTGIQPDAGTPELESFLANPPYGTSDATTFNIGTQFNHRLNNFFGTSNVLTLGTEYIYDDILDDIPAYRYHIDQTTKNFGAFLQSDWEITPSITLLSGLRMDEHNLVDHPVWSPRVSLLYKLRDFTQFRLNYGTGFRAPQAFDTDLHIAFAGGGISRVSLSPDLDPERSKSYSASVNFDKPTDHWVAGFTIEGFYNRLNNAFYLQPIGEDEFGEQFEKRNGDGATVQGITLELRANYDRKIQLESGFTFQSSQYDEAVSYIEGLDGIKSFIRTPEQYGYAILTFTPDDRFNAAINYVYTGSMKIPHFAGAPNQSTDEMIVSDPFSDVGLKLSYQLPLIPSKSNVELYGGIKNVFNNYQDDFDMGKNRDSNYIYGPSQPRTYFMGLKVGF